MNNSQKCAHIIFAPGDRPGHRLCCQYGCMCQFGQSSAHDVFCKCPEFSSEVVACPDPWTGRHLESGAQDCWAFKVQYNTKKKLVNSQWQMARPDYISQINAGGDFCLNINVTLFSCYCNCEILFIKLTCHLILDWHKVEQYVCQAGKAFRGEWEPLGVAMATTPGDAPVRGCSKGHYQATLQLSKGKPVSASNVIPLEKMLKLYIASSICSPTHWVRIWRPI